MRGVPKHNVPFAKDDVTDKCPVCGHPVRIVFRDHMHASQPDVEHIYADHYEPLMARRGWRGEQLLPADEETSKKLRKEREGKKTVAIVGMSPTSCSLAPFDDESVEIWAINEMHIFPWLTRWDRWFQIHDSKSWKRPVAKRDIVGHYDWLKEEHGKPIIMQHWHPEVPDSVAYPLKEVCDKFLGNLRRGEDRVKYFTSSLEYMVAYALWTEEVERIEIYGFEMADSIEYLRQKAGTEFWLGIALGRGLDIYLPPSCFILWSSLYGGNEQGAGW